MHVFLKTQKIVNFKFISATNKWVACKEVITSYNSCNAANAEYKDIQLVRTAWINNGHGIRAKIPFSSASHFVISKDESNVIRKRKLVDNSVCSKTKTPSLDSLMMSS